MANVNRRDVLRYGAAGAVTVATSVAAAQGLARADPPPGRVPSILPTGPLKFDFDESYRGKKIRGRLNLRGGLDELLINNKKLALTTIATLFVPEDGSAPYVGMGYISAINHYDPVEFDPRDNRDGLKKMAKKIVDLLGDLELGAEAALEHRH